MYTRTLDLAKELKKNSQFLFGPRATGKSFLIRNTLKPNLSINLLNLADFTRYSTQPHLLSEQCAGLKRGDIVTIDEIQKIPELTDQVHQLIEEQGLKFLLTGSSARKMKHGHANLLAGRAWTRELFPLTSKELGKNFDLIRYLNQGGLPRSYDSEDYLSELEAYTGTYLREEVHAESLTRNLQGFSRFLQVMAIQSGEELFFEGISKDCAVKAKTVANYIQILEDTLIGFNVPAYQKTKKRKAISRSKFYLFDVGVTGHLVERSIKSPKSESFGRALEQFIAQELRAYLSYTKKRLPLQYWRSTHQHEVDFVIGDHLAIEIKATERVAMHDLKNLFALAEESLVNNLMLVSMDPKPRKIKGVQIVPLSQFLEKLWDGEFIDL